MIFPQLNRYLAWSGRSDEIPILKNIKGMSRLSPKWVQTYIEKIATFIITNPSREQILEGVYNITHKAFLELESYWDNQINIQNLRFTSRVTQDLDKYKSKTCQSVILAKEQHATRGDIVFWYIADPMKTLTGKSYSSNALFIDVIGYKKWLWNKIKILLTNTCYFLNDDLRILEENLLVSSIHIQY